MPTDKQNGEWFQVSKVTLVSFSIIQYYNVQKMSGCHLSIAGFATQLSTKWGVASRLKPGQPPAPNTIPPKLEVRDTLEKKVLTGARYTLSEMMCSEAIIKGNIVMIINRHFEGQRMPKYAVTLYNCVKMDVLFLALTSRVLLQVCQ